MREVERSARSVEEAIEAALEELGVSEQEAEIEILREPQRGVLGIGAQDATVRVRVAQAPIDGAALEEQAEIARGFLAELLTHIGVEADVEQHWVDETMYVDVFGAEEEGMGLLIGKHGQTLEALQEIVRAAVQRQTASRSRIVVDVEDYRKRRHSRLAERARQAAKRVRRTGKPESLEPMSPFERKIVHDAVSEVGGVATASEGEEPERRVVIRKKG